eukprot:GEMP01010756.1.p1 GENE.GEMP01010756.1~~GEMP01010756.1.p1  ORF type:complete len:965 (+),score=242.64 GEMP01010756.1:58-2952(+)
MDLLNQIQVPYDATALCMLEKIQSQPMCLKDFTRENCLKLRTIIKATTHEEVRTAAVHVQAFVKKQFELQRHSLRQKTLVELGQRYPTIRPQVHMLENAFYHAFTSSTSEFAVKSDIYLARCTDVIGSMRSKFALLATDAPVESIKDLVASAVKSWDENAVTSPNGTKRPRDDEASPALNKKRPNGIHASVPDKAPRCPASPKTPRTPGTPGTPGVNGETASRSINVTPRPASSHDHMVATPAMDSSSDDDSSSESVESIVSDTSTYESDKELEKKFWTREKKRLRLPARKADPEAIERRKMFAAQRQNDRKKERTLKAEAKQEASRIKSAEKEKRKAERKRIRDEEKKAKREKKKQEEEERKALEEKERALWGSWMSSRFPGNESYDAKFTAAWAKAHARMQNESPRPQTYVADPEKPKCGGRSSPHGAAPTSSRASHPVNEKGHVFVTNAGGSHIPASVPNGGVVPGESVMDMLQRLERIVPYIHSFRGALRFLGAMNVEEAKKNYKKMLLHVHTDKLGPDATNEAKKRACGLMDALNKSKAKVVECSNEATVDRIDPPRKVTSKVDHYQVKISWEASAGAARYEVQVFDPKSDRYHTLAVCEPEFDAAANRYKTIEECTTTILSPGKFPKLVHLWHNETMQAQVTAVSQKGTKSAPASVEVALGPFPAGAPSRTTPVPKQPTPWATPGRPPGFAPRRTAWATDPAKTLPTAPRPPHAGAPSYGSAAPSTPRPNTPRPPWRAANSKPSTSRTANGDMPSASRSSTDYTAFAPRPATDHVPSTSCPTAGSAPFSPQFSAETTVPSAKPAVTETTPASDRPPSDAGPSVPVSPRPCTENAAPTPGRPPSTGSTVPTSPRPCTENAAPTPGRPPSTRPTVPVSPRPTTMNGARPSNARPPRAATLGHLGQSFAVPAAVRANARPLCPPRPSLLNANSGCASPATTGTQKAWKKWATRVTSSPVTK